MSNVVNVVGRKRVEARKDLIHRALSTELVTAGIYVYKHSIVIDSSVAFPRPITEASAQANALTTYDKNDITPPAPLRAGVSELFADPPRWLCRQVAEYRKAPYERMLGPLVQAVRLHIALARSPDDAPTAALRAGPGTAEIRPEVEREL